VIESAYCVRLCVFSSAATQGDPIESKNSPTLTISKVTNFCSEKNKNEKPHQIRCPNSKDISFGLEFFFFLQSHPS
jgi:hypothetical protein